MFAIWEAAALDGQEKADPDTSLASLYTRAITLPVLSAKRFCELFVRCPSQPRIRCRDANETSLTGQQLA